MIDGIPNRPLYFYQKDIIDNHYCVVSIIVSLWLFNIAMEHGPLIDDKHDHLPIEHDDFPWLR